MKRKKVKKVASAAHKKPGMDSFNYNIREEAKGVFEELADSLPGNKYELVEAMIYGFQSMPVDLQMRLLSSRPEIRNVALAVLSRATASEAEYQVPREKGRAASG